MNRFWSVFWKVFGVIVAVVLVASVVAGIVTQSVEITYVIAQTLLVSALGVCGVIGLTVPIGLYFEREKA